ncbi:STAND family AAA ATPase [Methyloradius palustris]|uniref:Calcineurin-like phosphoesterase domain-containing protein n=1 Tax=Methyloradius palustris TaxID=2778876 RepID=A0A8D5JMC3_9PROT|nr:metallophosphoesterase [Methyloradius palustris]BCM25720.1 hypothetical protein ZMTM_19790 [Methyloradius palustris]
MQISILHLSDIHFSDEENFIIGFNDEIARICYQSARECDAFFIIVTGDIAYSGSHSQYLIALEFLTRIKELVSAETEVPVNILVVPGNHDCVLKPIDSVRETIIGSIIANPELAKDSEIVANCTKAQKNYFDFESTILEIVPIYSDQLWKEIEVEITGQKIRFSLLNGAWMSQIPEEQGKLIYPVNDYEQLFEQPADLRFVLLHQPFNWYEQNTYQNFRKCLQGKAHFVLSGHEHVTNISVLDNDSGDTVYFEAGALQPHGSAIPTFSILDFKSAEQIVTENKFEIINGNIIQVDNPKIREFTDDKKNIVVKSKVSKEFLAQVNDPGGNFSHLTQKINLDDVFVYPDARNRCHPGNTAVITSTEKLISKIDDGTKLLFIGEEKAGKTVLLYQMFKECHLKGLFPLYLRASSINAFTDTDILKALRSCAAQQYVDVNCFEQSEKSKRVILIDDLDRLKGGPKFVAKLLQYLEKHFSAFVITADIGFEVTELLTPDAAEILKPYDTYELLRFNLRLRLQLVRKWCKCSDISNLQDYDKKVHQVESILNTVVGKNLVPSQPIYLLILLLSADQHQQSELQNSSFAYYYQYLITKSLKDVGLKPDKFNELFNYLANLAWLYSTTEIHQASLSELNEFNRIFSDKYITVQLKERLDLLTAAKILTRQDDYYSFTYPYIYYYFVGMYAAEHLSHPDNKVKQIVGDWCSNLNRRANAHSVLFLTHHSNDTWVIDQVANVLKNCFPEYKAMEFNGDTDVLNSLIDSVTGILIEAPNVHLNQMQLREMQDTNEQHDYEDSDTNDLKFIGKINLMLRTAEILGQILKNYYGSLEKTVKSDLLHQVVSGPLRLIRGIIEIMTEDPEALVKSIEGLIDDPEEKLDAARKKEAARKFAFRLLGLVSTNFIIKSAQNINTESLEEDLDAYVKKDPTNAKKLLYAATKLTQAGKIPMDTIRKLSEDLQPNAFAFTILQSLGVFHLYLFHTSFEEKQNLCKYLKISMDSSLSIDLLHSKTKMIGKQNT